MCMVATAASGLVQLVYTDDKTILIHPDPHVLRQFLSSFIKYAVYLFNIQIIKWAFNVL